MIAVMFSPYLSVRGFTGFVPGSVLFRPDCMIRQNEQGVINLSAVTW